MAIHSSWPLGEPLLTEMYGGCLLKEFFMHKLAGRSAGANSGDIPAPCT